MIGTFEHWYRIKTFNNDEGWVKKIMLNRKRHGIIKKGIFKQSDKLYTPIYSKNNVKSNVNAYIENSTRVFIESCNTNFCRINVKDVQGWVEKTYLYGIYLNEQF